MQLKAVNEELLLLETQHEAAKRCKEEQRQLNVQLMKLQMQLQAMEKPEELEKLLNLLYN